MMINQRWLGGQTIGRRGLGGLAHRCRQSLRALALDGHGLLLPPRLCFGRRTLIRPEL